MHAFYNFMTKSYKLKKDFNSFFKKDFDLNLNPFEKKKKKHLDMKNCTVPPLPTCLYLCMFHFCIDQPITHMYLPFHLPPCFYRPLSLPASSLPSSSPAL